MQKAESQWRLDGFKSQISNLQLAESVECGSVGIGLLLLLLLLLLLASGLRRFGQVSLSASLVNIINRIPQNELHVLAEGGEEVHEALDGKGTGAVAHQGRNVRLLNAEDLASFGLLEAATFNEVVNPKGKLGLQEFLFWWGRPRSAKTFPLLFSARIGFRVLATLVLPFSVEAFRLSQAVTDEVDVLLWGGDAPF